MARARTLIAALSAAALLAIGKVGRHADEARPFFRLSVAHSQGDEIPRLEPADALSAAEQGIGGASDD
jgi:hypothetical protein